MYRIYGLKLKNSEYIKYIGYTRKTIKQRLSEHLKTTIKGNYKNGYWLNKYKENVEIFLIEDGISSYGEACIKEIRYIKLYRELGYDINNTTDGGEGCQGLKHSDETKEKIREKIKGRKHSKESKDKMSANHPLKGKSLSEDVKRKISEAQKGKTRVYKNQKVEVFDYKTGEYLVIYESYVDAARQLGICPSHIAKVALGKRKQTGGYTFKKANVETYNLNEFLS